MHVVPHGSVPHRWNETAARLLDVPVSARRSPASKKGEQKTSTNRNLTPAKLAVAWKKVCHTVRERCKLRGCVFCRVEGNRIEFQLEGDNPAIALAYNGDRIVAKICNKQWTIRIVRIRTTTGSAYEFRHKRYSAWRLLGEMLVQARIVADARKPKALAVLERDRQQYIRQLNRALQRYGKALAKFSKACQLPTALPAEQRFLFEQLTAHREQILAELRALDAEPL